MLESMDVTSDTFSTEKNRRIISFLQILSGIRKTVCRKHSRINCLLWNPKPKEYSRGYSLFYLRLWKNQHREKQNQPSINYSLSKKFSVLISEFSSKLMVFQGFLYYLRRTICYDIRPFSSVSFYECFGPFYRLR